jgi:23S rRNA (adenine2030-N6)-methyltransferase
LNYLHGFHAGNFADVHKHVLLLAVLDHLTAKPAPFCYVDTHAGRGTYDLRNAEAVRSGECLLDNARWQDQPGLRRYVGVLRELGVEPSNPTSYPGSPLIATAAMRPSDRAVLIEQQPGEAAVLRTAIARRKHTAVICGDGYRELDAHVPPRERRGLVLIDPPYESTSEYADLARSLIAAHGRWSSGIYMAWYPLKAGDPARALRSALQASSVRRILCCELAIRPRDSIAGLNGSGLVIVNPPWQLDQRAAKIQAALQPILVSQAPGSSSVDWLVPE